MINRRQLLALVTIALFGVLPLVAQQAQNPDKQKEIGGKFLCMCGCNQVLTQCNHVGCTTSASMLKQIDQSITRGESEQAITDALVSQFTSKVFAEPPKTGFSIVAWAMPVFYFLIGLALVVFVILRWRRPEAAPAAISPAASGAQNDALARARERVDRETED